MVNFYSWVILEIFLFLFGDLQFSHGVLMSGFIFPEPAFYMVETLRVQNSQSSPLQIFIPCHPLHFSFPKNSNTEISIPVPSCLGFMISGSWLTCVVFLFLCSSILSMH